MNSLSSIETTRSPLLRWPPAFLPGAVGTSVVPLGPAATVQNSQFDGCARVGPESMSHATTPADT